MSGTPTMTCEIFGDRLMDFLEGEQDSATRAAMEAHVRQCAQCGALLADLRRVRAEAGRLPTLSPSRDLWGGIEARIAAPVVRIDEARPFWRSSRLLGLAMAAAVVFAAALGYEVASHRAAAPVPPATAVSASAGASQATLAANRRAAATPSAVEKSYDQEIAGLRAVLDTRRSHLDPATVAVIEKNLAVIDSAIAQCKAALVKDPASRYLMQSLSQSLDTKVQLLRIAAALPSRT